MPCAPNPEAGRILFIPGRSSRLVGTSLELSEASIHRVDVAVDEVSRNPSAYDLVAFAGGFPGLSEDWSIEPAASDREGFLMDTLFQQKLLAKEANEKGEGGMSPTEIRRLVRSRGNSSDTIGDILDAVTPDASTGEPPLLDPDYFLNPSHELVVVGGLLHFLRIRMAATRALNIENSRVKRVRMRDVYPEHTPAEGERRPLAKVRSIGKEVIGIAATWYTLRKVERGDLDGLREAHGKLTEAIERRRAKKAGKSRTHSAPI